MNGERRGRAENAVECKWDRTGGRSWSYTSSEPYTGTTAGTGSEHVTTDDSDADAGRARGEQNGESRGMERADGKVIGDRAAWVSDYVDAAFLCKSVDIGAIWCKIPDNRCQSTRSTYV